MKRATLMTVALVSLALPALSEDLGLGGLGGLGLPYEGCDSLFDCSNAPPESEGGQRFADQTAILECFNTAPTAAMAQNCVMITLETCMARQDAATPDVKRQCAIAEATIWLSLDMGVTMNAISDDAEARPDLPDYTALAFENWGIWQEDIAEMCGVAMFAVSEDPDVSAEQAVCWARAHAQHAFALSKSDPA